PPESSQLAADWSPAATQAKLALRAEGLFLFARLPCDEPFLRAMTRKPSCLISCSHPDDKFVVLIGRHGAIKPAGRVRYCPRRSLDPCCPTAKFAPCGRRHSACVPTRAPTSGSCS